MKKVSIWHFPEYSPNFQLFLTAGLMDQGVSLHLTPLGVFFFYFPPMMLFCQF